MEFDLKNLDFLKLKIIKTIRETREYMNVLVFDPRSKTINLIKIFDNRDEEKHEYKILKYL